MPEVEPYGTNPHVPVFVPASRCPTKTQLGWEAIDVIRLHSETLSDEPSWTVGVQLSGWSVGGIRDSVFGADVSPLFLLRQARPLVSLAATGGFTD